MPTKQVFNPFTGTFDTVLETDRILLRRTAAQTLSGQMLVVPTGTSEVERADAAILAHAYRPVWLTTGAVIDGDTATVLAYGAIEEPSWTWTPHMPIFLGLDGMLTQTAPDAPATFVLQVAIATASFRIFYNPKVAVLLA